MTVEGGVCSGRQGSPQWEGGWHEEEVRAPVVTDTARLFGVV